MDFLAASRVLLFALVAGMASGLEITSTGSASIEVASGQTDYPVMKDRVHFNAADPKNGDASINLTGLRSTDTGVYQCKVKKAPGIRSRKIKLTASNRVGSDECILHLNITPPPNTAGIIAGAIIGVLLFLILLAIILFCCCRARQKKKYEKEICNEIREDVPPPKSRVSTARSFTSVGSHRSSLGSMTPSNLHEYALKPQYDKIPSSEDFDRPPSSAPLAPPVLPAPAPRMAGPNLSRMGGIPVMIPAQNRDGSIAPPIFRGGGGGGGGGGGEGRDWEEGGRYGIGGGVGGKREGLERDTGL
ncbi:hypothetical protein CRUP_017580 [Coryphaenoides rupestris]|nr:hypothetical protein CRUP_017580 [Coryphaenoides rupestris]